LENALFYTFSTIAQTLAGAIALLAAFVLYRLQALNAGIDQWSQTILGLYGGPDRRVVDDHYVRGQLRELLSYITEHPPDAGEKHLDVPVSRLDSLLRQRKAVLAGFKCSLLLTVLLVAASVMALAFTPDISRASYSLIVLIIGILWLGGCLASYAWLVNKALP